MRVSSSPFTTLLKFGRSTAGNVAIMSAFAVIPLLAMVGGAVDASRTYMAYTRLQQACDSGALAGRKAMSNITQLSDTEKAKANEFFDFNFPAQTYAAQNITRSFVKGANGVVVGEASLSMPTTLMKMFGYTSTPLRVSCQATLNIPNTDVMFVLDVTGSMDWTPAGGTTSDETQKRIYGLKQAVKDFYSALGPGAKTGAGRVRYGFVPYASNVNVGRILYNLNPQYVLGGLSDENWEYPSRRGDIRTGYYESYGRGYYYDYVNWTWISRSVNVRPWVISSGSVANPAYWQGNPNGYNYDAPQSFAWNGCIEESSTNQNITAASGLQVPSDANDLKIDLKPSNSALKWKPALTQLMYFPGDPRYRVGADPCPREASALTQYVDDYNSASKRSASFDAYVNSLVATGATYHDIGLIWGARFLSPDGIYSATNSDAAAPGGYQVSRHIVFMTDGSLDTSEYWPDAWGSNMISGRVAPTNAKKARLDESHTKRTEIICNEMKGKGFTIWVVGFGSTGLSQTLKDCASDKDHWSEAKDTATLRQRFAQIAQTIGGLRLSS